MKSKIIKMFKKVIRYCKNVLIRRLKGPDLISLRLNKLSISCNEYFQKNNRDTGLRILWPTTFNLSKTWWGHDGILAVALKLRGADIFPTMCDRIQSDECMFWGGEWQGHNNPRSRKRRENNCRRCVANDKEMWGRWGLNPLRLSSFVTASEKLKAKNEVAGWVAGDWEKVIWNGFPVGYEAWKAVVNNNLQAEIHESWREEAKSLAYSHLLNIYLLLLAYERVFDVVAPERVFGNGGFYYLWGVVDHIARQRKVPYFRYHNIGLNSFVWNYARNSKELIDVGPAWQSWLEQPWDSKKEDRVSQDLFERGVHIGGILNKKRVLSKIIQTLPLDPKKSIALCATGVAWDATANVPSRAFRNMYDWLWETIRWFAGHPEWQLVIRVHPDENIVSNIASERRTRFENELSLRGIKIPQNVFIIPSSSRISVYDLIDVASLGIVYTSTTGLEMACAGLPVIAIGHSHFRNKGFTLDPSNRSDYFFMLEKILSNNIALKSEGSALLAKKYWYLYAYHASVATGVFDLNENWVHVPKELTYQDLLPGANIYLDYICDSVMNDLPIFGENRWPPENKIKSKINLSCKIQ